jgi:hypothetical protein
MTNRRQFITKVGIGSAVIFAGRAIAESATVSESDALPASMGYKADGTKVDKVKFPKYAASEKCATCTLFQGKAGDSTGPCTLFSGKLVSAEGWCNAWAKKA